MSPTAPKASFLTTTLVHVSSDSLLQPVTNPVLNVMARFLPTVSHVLLPPYSFLTTPIALLLVLLAFSKQISIPAPSVMRHVSRVPTSLLVNPVLLPFL